MSSTDLFMREEISAMIPHYLWRVVSSRSRRYDPPPFYYWSRELCDDEQLSSWVSSHMLEKQYLAPCRIVSFTVSLLWALSYARFQLKEGATSVELYLVDTLELPRDVRIVSAANIAKFLHIKPQGVHWHDDPYHEYLLFGCLPRDDNAIVGRINFQGIHPGFNALVPGFDCRLREGLHASLDRFRMTWEGLFACLATGAEISANDISIARQVVDELIPPIEDKDVHFRITMMFLSLRKRKWDQGGFQKLRDAFAGVRIPSTYLFTSRDSIIHHKMVDLEEWVRGMEYVRFECIIAEKRLQNRRT